MLRPLLILADLYIPICHGLIEIVSCTRGARFTDSVSEWDVVVMSRERNTSIRDNDLW